MLDLSDNCLDPLPDPLPPLLLPRPSADAGGDAAGAAGATARGARGAFGALRSLIVSQSGTTWQVGADAGKRFSFKALCSLNPRPLKLRFWICAGAESASADRSLLLQTVSKRERRTRRDDGWAHSSL